MQLVFQSPAAARVGDNFDVRVAIAARQPVARVVVEVTYDPVLLRVRTAEETDYAMRESTDRAFSIHQSNEGQVELVLRPSRRETALEVPATVPLLQFEAIKQGSTAVRIGSVSAFDPASRSLALSVIGQESRIVVD